MTNPSTTTTARPLGFGFGRPPQAAAAAPAATLPAAATPNGQGAPMVSESAAPTRAPAAPSTSVEISTGDQQAGQVPAVHEPTGEIELVAVLGNEGSRGDAIFAGVFGSMQGAQFRVDPLLKPIYLLSLIDGAVPGVKSEGMAAIGALPAVTVVPVPVELAAGFKATLAHLSATRWAELYDELLGGNMSAVTRFALENDARLSNEVVTRIMAENGTPFTVQVSTPVRQVFTGFEEDDGADEEDVSTETAATPTVTTTTSGAPATLDSEGYRALHLVSSDRDTGDVVTYNQVNMFAVFSPDEASAGRILALIPQGLKRASAQSVNSVTLNGVPFVLPAPAEAEPEEQSQPVDRP